MIAEGAPARIVVPADGILGQTGQGLVEYGLILVIMGVACVVSLVFFGEQLSTLLNLIASAV